MASLPSAFAALQVNPANRAEVRAFFNAVYHASDAVPIDTTAKVASCFPGTNSSAFKEAVVRRINWFRAMAGVPAAILLNDSFSSDAQSAALMMSAQGEFNHAPTNGWPCWTAAGSNAANNANLSIDTFGPDAIASYIDDFGSANTAVGHRRWMLYPQTQTMGTGDVPAQNGHPSANATWVFDDNFGGSRPPTRRTEVTWPPAGFVPYPVVFRRWSFSYPAASFSSAVIYMMSNGVPISVSKETVVNGYGENTAVWVPAGVNPDTPGFHWPRPGTDTIYSVTVSNVLIRGISSNFTYSVTVFDPDVMAVGETVTTVSGSSSPILGRDSAYSIRPVSYATQYEWRASQRSPLVFSDGVESGTTNFAVFVSPTYPVVLAGVGADGSWAFHLAHPQPVVAQTLTIQTLFTPATNGAISFKSRLGYSGDGEFARVQISTDGADSWVDVYAQQGTGGAGESSFVTRNVALGGYAGRSLQLRFSYAFVGGNFYSQTDANTGWLIDDIVLTNCWALLQPVGGMAAGTNFIFRPTVVTNYVIEARGLMFDVFGLSWSPLLGVNPVVPPEFLAPVRIGSQLKMEFIPGTTPTSNLQLYKAPVVSGPWSQDTTAILDTNLLSGRPRFSTTLGATGQAYFRIAAP